VHIASDEYFCIHQLVKNAKKNILKKNEGRNLIHLPAVHIKATRQEGHPYISVKDFGTGIGYDNLHKIFGGFTDTEEGTGIGLQLVKRLIELKNASGIVISKVAADRGWGYCIRTKKTKEMLLEPRPNNLEHASSGTLFKLYFSEI
jgi:nitrogen fixation/metabolism regulation signal transduction histidine kinase